jgi:hypothetical protein
VVVALVSLFFFAASLDHSPNSPFLILSGPAILVGHFIMALGLSITAFSGFVGRKNTVNGCMNCGHTWMPKNKALKAKETVNKKLSLWLFLVLSNHP